MESQNNIIKDWLLSGKSITPLQALDLFGCLRLSARIENLRSNGMPIKTEIVQQNGKRFAKYSYDK